MLYRKPPRVGSRLKCWRTTVDVTNETWSFGGWPIRWSLRLGQNRFNIAPSMKDADHIKSFFRRLIEDQIVPKGLLNGNHRRPLKRGFAVAKTLPACGWIASVSQVACQKRQSSAPPFWRPRPPRDKEFASGGRGAPKGETLRAASFPLRPVALLFTGLEQIRRFGF